MAVWTLWILRFGITRVSFKWIMLRNCTHVGRCARERGRKLNIFQIAVPNYETFGRETCNSN